MANIRKISIVLMCTLAVIIENMLASANDSAQEFCEYIKMTNNVCKKCDIYAIVPLSSQEKVQILHLHNKFRDIVAIGKEHRGYFGPQPPAGNMHILAWNENLELSIQRRLSLCNTVNDTLKNIINEDSESISGYVNIGIAEDMYMDKIILESIILNWYNEVMKFNKENVPSFVPMKNKKVERYTRFVWARSKHIACIRIFLRENSTRNFIQLICEYMPRGNVKNLPIYEVGKPCSKCPKKTKCSKVYSGLCEADAPTDPRIACCLRSRGGPTDTRGRPAALGHRRSHGAPRAVRRSVLRRRAAREVAAGGRRGPRRSRRGRRHAAARGRAARLRPQRVLPRVHARRRQGRLRPGRGGRAGRGGRRVRRRRRRQAQARHPAPRRLRRRGARAAGRGGRPARRQPRRGDAPAHGRPVGPRVRSGGTVGGGRRSGCHRRRGPHAATLGGRRRRAVRGASAPGGGRGPRGARPHGPHGARPQRGRAAAGAAGAQEAVGGNCCYSIAHQCSRNIYILGDVRQKKDFYSERSPNFVVNVLNIGLIFKWTGIRNELCDII